MLVEKREQRFEVRFFESAEPPERPGYRAFSEPSRKSGVR